MNESEDERDERIRKKLIEIIGYFRSRGIDQQLCEEFLAYLEKQKEKGRNITANLLEDGITGVQRELIEFLANNIDASWVDVIKSADAYAQRIRSMVEKQKEQKPSPKFRVGDMMRTKQEAAEEINDGIPVVVSIDEDYYICNNEKIPITDQEEYEFPPMNMRQKPAEWSEEDEQLLGFVYDLLADSLWNSKYAMSRDECLNRLTSLRQRLRPRHSWKASEEQMEALEKALYYVPEEIGIPIAEIYGHFNKMKKKLM